MKGPGLRNDLEIRRTWKCPQCSRTVKYLGNVVAVTCSCTDSRIQMQLQPEIRKAPPKFEKVVIPLTEEDLIVRERPRRMPEPSENGTEVDRRPLRPKRPKPERRSFESFQEQLGTAESSEITDATPTDEIHQESVPESPDVPQSQAPIEDVFGEGLA
ncbi:MAG: hypothetical protein JWM11_1663 [Planctomycetaceae bacterium]|nr:hypothetical protein [Planctomycetaceae bacterium]